MESRNSKTCNDFLFRYECCINIYILDTYRRNDNRRSNKGRKKTSLEKYSPLTLLQGFERVVEGLHVRGCWRPNVNFIFWPHCYDRHVVSFLFSKMINQRSLGSTAGCWLSLLHLSIFSGPQLIRASSPIGLVWLSLPHLVSNSLEFYWQLLWHPNSTELNNNSTPTRSPTGSSKADV